MYKFRLLMATLFLVPTILIAQEHGKVGEITESQTRDLGTRMWRAKLGKFSVVGTIVDLKAGKVRLRKQDGKVITVPIEVLHPSDRIFLSKLAWAGKEEMPLHEALALDLIQVRTENYAQEKISIYPKGRIVAPRITIPNGTWIELDGHRKAGRIYLRTGDRNVSVDPNKGRGTTHGIGHYVAIPGDHLAIVPVIETIIATETKVNHSSISRTGFDPVAAKILGDKKSPKKDDILGMTAGILMMEKPDLELKELQDYATRVFTNRMNRSQNRLTQSNSRRAGLLVWNATSEHLVMGEHLLGKAKFNTHSSATAASGASQPTRTNKDKHVNLADALAAGHLKVSGRKGLNGRLILKLTRTKIAPRGPMQVALPIGTVLLVDDGKGGDSMRLYPLYEKTIALFGTVEGGAQVPVLYGSYKRKIITTRELLVTVEFDPKVAKLFKGQPESQYLQMAVEAVLLDRDDLDRNQVQYHISRVGVPGDEAPMAVTKELIDIAKRRIAGDATAVAKVAVPVPLKTGRNRKTPKTASPPAKSTAKPVALIQIDPDKPSGPMDENENTRAAWREMVKFTPEYPEQDIVGTWTTVSQSEALRYILALFRQRANGLALAAGQELSAEEKSIIETNAKRIARSANVYRGSLAFDAGGEFTGTLAGRSKRNDGKITGKWSFNGATSFRIIGPNPIHELHYVAKDHLIFVDVRGTPHNIVVLKKSN